MKRSVQEVMGWPMLRNLHTDVAGGKARPASLDVASDRAPVREGYGPMPARDAELMTEFAEFMRGDEGGFAGAATEPNPDFRERLRRQLWRNHVFARVWDGDRLH